jgi:hypothetical protein
MTTTAIFLPEEHLPEINEYRDRLEELLLLGLRQMKIEESLHLYTTGQATFARCAELAGLPHDEMVLYARIHGIEPQWSQQMVEEELA